MPAVANTPGRLHCELVRNLFLQAHRETDLDLLARSAARRLNLRISFLQPPRYKPIQTNSAGWANEENDEFTLPKALDSIMSSILRYEVDGSPFTIYW